jgi:hypothetical protein
MSFDSARHPERPVARQRPSDASDATIEALGKLSEALEIVEDARGALYHFHRMSGSADQSLQEAVGLLRDAGWKTLADEIDQTLVGRDVIAGRWTFQIVDEYDEGYWQIFRALEQQARTETGVLPKHVYEAEMKVAEQSS